MRIIYQPAPVKEVEVTCQNFASCKTVCACEPSDFAYMSDPRDGDALKWVCPNCGRSNWVAVSTFDPAFVRAVQQYVPPTMCVVRHPVVKAVKDHLRKR